MAIVRKKNNSTKGSTSDATTPKEIKHGTKPYTTTRRSHFTKLSRRTKIPETTNINCALSETQWKASKAGGDHHRYLTYQLVRNVTVLHQHICGKTQSSVGNVTNRIAQHA